MSDTNTTVDALRRKVIGMCLKKGWGENGVQDPQHVAMAMTVEMSEVLEHFQWLDARDVEALMNGDDEERRRAIAEEIADVTNYLLQLTYALKIDLSEEVERKIAIVERRPDRPDEHRR